MRPSELVEFLLTIRELSAVARSAVLPARAVVLLEGYATDRLRELGREQYGRLAARLLEPSGTDVFEAVAEDLAHSVRRATWTVDVCAEATRVGDLIRQHLLRLAQRIQEESQRFGTDVACSDPLALAALRDWVGFHTAGESVREVPQGAWLLGEYLGLSPDDCEQLTLVPASSFERALRKVRWTVLGFGDRLRTTLHEIDESLFARITNWINARETIALARDAAYVRVFEALAPNSEMRVAFHLAFGQACRESRRTLTSRLADTSEPVLHARFRREFESLRDSAAARAELNKQDALGEEVYALMNDACLPSEEVAALLRLSLEEVAQVEQRYQTAIREWRADR